MTELTKIEQAAVGYWKSVGGYTNFDLTTKVIEARHQEEHLRIYKELEGQ